MKHLDVIASVVLAAAVLLAAYAIGRLVRQSRLEKGESPSPAIAQPNEAATPDAAEAALPPNRRRPEPTPEERAEIKAERAETLAQVSSLTDEEKLQLRDDMRQRLRSRSGKPGRVPRLSPEELETLSRQLAEMTEEEKRAFLARRLGRGSRGASGVTTDANESQPEGSARSRTTEPNSAGQD